MVEIVTFPKADEASVRIARSLKAEADPVIVVILVLFNIWGMSLYLA